MGSKERVIQYIGYKNITKYKFCKDLGFSNKFLDASSNMGTDYACIILQHFPDLSPEWLLTGKGSMLKVDAPTSTPEEMGLQQCKELAEARQKQIELLEDEVSRLQAKA